MQVKFSAYQSKWILAAGTGFLLGLSWVPLPFPFFLFGAFVPLLSIEHDLAQHHSRRTVWVMAKYAYLGFLLWNLFAGWWVYKTSMPAAFLAILLNAALMTIPFLLFHKTKQLLGGILGYISLPCYWISFEYFHYHCEAGLPWLTLGNGFARFPELVQWYEYTGVFGGSVFILVINLLIFLIFKGRAAKPFSSERAKRTDLFYKSGLVAASILLPAVSSLALYATYEEKGERKHVVIIQPNIDPYTEKFQDHAAHQHFNKMLRMTLNEATPQTDFILWPETALAFPNWLHAMASNAAIKTLQRYVEQRPNTRLIIGSFVYEHYDRANGSTTARKYEGGFYDIYNTVIHIDSSRAISYYYKSKLVPGFETVPYASRFKFLEKLAIQLKGINGSLGKQKELNIFRRGNADGVAPVICYESIYGEYITQQIKQGAQAIFILTNDGWWDKTPGHRQHLHYASLRAIETRRSIARCANTGISCIITQRGEIKQATAYDEETAFSSSIRMNQQMTFYVRYGDYLAKPAVLGTLFFSLFMCLKKGREMIARMPSIKAFFAKEKIGNWVRICTWFRQS
jgi:apolipoprotein N-acyltransferase